jgi:hypothetical protein
MIKYPSGFRLSGAAASGNTAKWEASGGRQDKRRAAEIRPPDELSLLPSSGSAPIHLPRWQIKLTARRCRRHRRVVIEGGKEEHMKSTVAMHSSWGRRIEWSILSSSSSVLLPVRSTPTVALHQVRRWGYSRCVLVFLWGSIGCSAR